jgi:phenol 2-monooxygenase (NADPH)
VQYHLNGFRPGDPEISEPAEQLGTPNASEPTLPEAVDVLIVGCGPAGLTLAAQLAAFPQIKTRIVEQKVTRLLIGQADGLACRTLEMFEAFGFSGRVLKEAYWVNETTFWEPDDRDRQHIVRSRVIQDVEDGLSEFPHVILNQARVHDFFLEVMRNSPTRLEPDYSRRLINLSIAGETSAEYAASSGAGPRAYPVRVTLERPDPPHKALVETIRAGFVVGCDGARSTVRKSLGLALRADSANQAWGVMDVLAVTDFPDIRRKSAIHSAREGSVLIIPREGGYLVRFYIELDKLNQNERVSSRAFTADHLIAAARRVLHPYTLEVKEIAWWSIYEIGHRLCEKFDDVLEHEIKSRFPRVFIAGDACHTHSPKAGQGMNVSMQDSFNLGWKLASVILGRCSPEILHTYSSERWSVARELIDFDQKFARMFSARPGEPAGSDSDTVSTTDFQDYFVMQGRFTAGTATRYQPSMISGEPTYQHLARGFEIGTRFHSAPVIRLADAKPIQLGHTVKADGRWRLFAFSDANHPANPSSRLRRLCDFLGASVESPVSRYTSAAADVDSVIEVLTVLQQGHRELAIEAMPSFMMPRKGRYRLIDYAKVYCPDFKGRNDIFDLRSVDRSNGCMVVVRPDQYVANVLPLDAFAELSEFFGGFMTRVY